MKNNKKLIVIISAVLIFIILNVYNIFVVNPHDITVREETISSKKIDKNLNNLIVVYFSDLNYGSNLTIDDLDKTFSLINDFDADVVIFGGDLAKNSCDETLANYLSNINAKYGKFAVLGEIDIYDEKTKSTLIDCGFHILENSNAKIYINGSYINIVGIDPIDYGSPNIESSFEGTNPEYFTFVVSHCPDIADNVDVNKSDYMLSAHTFGGQVYLPIINNLYRPLGAKKYYRGKNYINDLCIDISNGLGTKEKDIRFNADAEIVVYKLKSE